MFLFESVQIDELQYDGYKRPNIQNIQLLANYLNNTYFNGKIPVCIDAADMGGTWYKYKTNTPRGWHIYINRNKTDDPYTYMMNTKSNERIVIKSIKQLNITLTFNSNDEYTFKAIMWILMYILTYANKAYPLKENPIPLLLDMPNSDQLMKQLSKDLPDSDELILSSAPYRYIKDYTDHLYNNEIRIAAYDENNESKNVIKAKSSDARAYVICKPIITYSGHLNVEPIGFGFASYDNVKDILVPNTQQSIHEYIVYYANTNESAIESLKVSDYKLICNKNLNWYKWSYLDNDEKLKSIFNDVFMSSIKVAYQNVKSPQDIIGATMAYSKGTYNLLN